MSADWLSCVSDDQTVRTQFIPAKVMLQYFNVHEYRGGRGGAEIHDIAGARLAGAGRPVHVAGPGPD